MLIEFTGKFNTLSLHVVVYLLSTLYIYITFDENFSLLVRLTGEFSGITSPQLIESVGVRESDEDYCTATGSAGKSDYFCRNDGICYSTNDGPKCDCSFTDFRGNRCEQGI